MGTWRNANHGRGALLEGPQLASCTRAVGFTNAKFPLSLSVSMQLRKLRGHLCGETEAARTSPLACLIVSSSETISKGGSVHHRERESSSWIPYLGPRSKTTLGCCTVRSWALVHLPCPLTPSPGSREEGSPCSLWLGKFLLLPAFPTFSFLSWAGNGAKSGTCVERANCGCMFAASCAPLGA